MDKKDRERGSALERLFKSSEIKKIGMEYTEVGIDAFIESGVLQSIPLVSTIVGLCKATGTVKDQLFTEKLVRFLTNFSDLNNNERIDMVEKLNEDNKFAGKAGARLIEIIDRMETENKPELAACFFKAFARDEIDFETLRRLLFALERVPAFDLDYLALFSSTSGSEMSGSDEPRLLGYVNSGLAMNNGGMDGGHIVPTQLCKTFVKAGELKVKKAESNLEHFFE
ncbi:hypothetical protein BANRA_05126 [Escherichia coli]|uniref:hypothetical protein n=1 Tax=Escherichia coli TaxID=562 RepID=UPI000F26DA48|nr:hypothetical protein [Escherichia coli]CAI6211105.1 hypothetical protein DJICPGNB_23240 [Escherichia coli]VCY53378.1 hypothetical protein BANRA_05130 [Escherichia coli]VDB01604.1 hypothetical protein BANRA_05126 [Escherichia coli]